MAGMSERPNIVLERYGRSLHLRIRSAEDLRAALELDEAHWVATGAPVEMFHADGTFLALLDADGTGRILCHEVRRMISFALAALADHTPIDKRSAGLDPATLADTPEGRQVALAAEDIRERWGTPGEGGLTIDHIREVKRQTEAMPVSEAGVVLPEAASDPEIGRFIADVVATVGGGPHPSGGRGVDADRLALFLSETRRYLDWRSQGQIPAGQERTDIMPLGADTPKAYHAYAALKSKIEQYFAQCLALSVDVRFAQQMGWTESELAQLDLDEPAAVEQVLRKAPLAPPSAEPVLPLDQSLNPYYLERVDAFKRDCMAPILGQADDRLTAEQWQRIKAALAAHEDWLGAREGDTVETLDVARLERYLEPRFAEQVRALIAERKRTAAMLDEVRAVETLLLCQLHLIDFANNFVSFPHLYDPHGRAMFEMGTLVMDGRRFNLAVRVPNRAEHRLVAVTSTTYVLYVEVTSSGRSPQTLAVPVTSGGKGNLCIGKRGVFYDLSGAEYDARVVDVVENPISFREAVFSPFVRLGRALVGKIESLTTAAEQKLDARISEAVQRASAPPPAPPVERPAGVSRAGIIVGAGVTIAALGSALAYVTKTLATIDPLRIVLALLAAALMLLIPVSIVAIIKLRRRDLSTILEGSGWAINARMRLTRRQSRFFTMKPKYPAHAEPTHFPGPS